MFGPDKATVLQVDSQFSQNKGPHRVSEALSRYLGRTLNLASKAILMSQVNVLEVASTVSSQRATAKQSVELRKCVKEIRDGQTQKHTIRT